MSNRQRRYYFGQLVRPLAEGFGWTVDDMHNWLKAKFLSEIIHVTQPNGEVMETRKILSMKIGKGVSTKRIEKYYEDIRMFGVEYGYNLRKPNEDELGCDFIDCEKI